MRIALIGQAPFGAKVLTELHSRGEEIVHVFTPPETPGKAPDPLRAKAVELGIPNSQPASFKTEAAYEHFRSLEADLAILAFVTIIVPERILYTPRYTSICFHPSLLPRHRGASAINWAIIHGDSETGVTVFWPDRGIDTGPILLQKRAPIDISDTVGSLYFNRLFPLGVEAIVESVELIKEGRAPRIPQDESQATYEPPCRDEHARIDFEAPPRRVYDLVRGTDPQPGAWLPWGERKLRLYEPALSSTGSGGARPGTVVGIENGRLQVALRGGALLSVAKGRLDPDGKKIPIAELASEIGLQPGTVLT